MRRIWDIWLLEMIFSGVLAGTGSAYIIDTGPGPLDKGYAVLGGGENVAAEFFLNRPSNITSIEGHIVCFSSGDLIVAIYSDSGEVPGTKIYSSSFSISANPLLFDWYGLKNLNWSLNSGTYWVAFETPPIGSVSAQAGLLSPSFFPLLNEAYMPYGADKYIEADYLNIGVRIDGSEVPLPGALLLLGAGLLRLAHYRRRKSAPGN